MFERLHPFSDSDHILSRTETSWWCLYSRDNTRKLGGILSALICDDRKLSRRGAVNACWSGLHVLVPRWALPSPHLKLICQMSPFRDFLSPSCFFVRYSPRTVKVFCRLTIALDMIANKSSYSCDRYPFVVVRLATYRRRTSRYELMTQKPIAFYLLLYCWFLFLYCAEGRSVCALLATHFVIVTSVARMPEWFAVWKIRYHSDNRLHGICLYG